MPNKRGRKRKFPRNYSVPVPLSSDDELANLSEAHEQLDDHHQHTDASNENGHQEPHREHGVTIGDQVYVQGDLEADDASGDVPDDHTAGDLEDGVLEDGVLEAGDLQVRHDVNFSDHESDPASADLELLHGVSPVHDRPALDRIEAALIDLRNVTVENVFRHNDQGSEEDITVVDDDDGQEPLQNVMSDDEDDDGDDDDPDPDPQGKKKLCLQFPKNPDYQRRKKNVVVFSLLLYRYCPGIK